MDIQNLLRQLLSADAVKGLSKASGASQKDVRNVLNQALPLLLDGAKAQAGGDTAAGFTQALSDHAQADTSDMLGFLKNIDLADGAKIIGHLLGGEKDSTTKKLAKKTGVSEKKTGNILASVGPLLMSLLGKQTGSDGDFPIGDLMGSLLSNVDLGSLLGSLLGGSTQKSSKKTTKKSSKKSSDSLGTTIGKIIKSFLKK